jgi:hypothetical protein
MTPPLFDIVATFPFVASKYRIKNHIYREERIHEKSKKIGCHNVFLIHKTCSFINQ